MMVPEYQSHGLYDMKVFGRLLRIRAAGAWNELTAQQFNIQYKRCISDLDDESWIAFFDLRHWGLTVPEARPYLADLVAWPAPQGTGDHMFLFNGLNIQESLVSDLLRVASHDSYFFSTANEVTDWLKKRQFQSEEIAVILNPIKVPE